MVVQPVLSLVLVTLVNHLAVVILAVTEAPALTQAASAAALIPAVTAGNKFKGY